MNNIFTDKFEDYYLNNKGVLFKSFNIIINNFHNSYDIYWGEPSVIFDEKAINEKLPLAVTVFPRKMNAPNPRIFMHEKFDMKYAEAFEMVIAHEIGHIWLHEVTGIDNQMKESDLEIWADYFAYSFFVKFRNIDCLERFNLIIKKACILQIQIYNLGQTKRFENLFIERAVDLKSLEEKIKKEIKINNSMIIQMIDTIEITLNALGDIFK